MITLKCKACGTDYQVRNYRAATSNFCSRECGGRWHWETGLSKVSRAYMKGNKLRQGLKPANSFNPGHATWNKGLKGTHHSPASEFKPGMVPANKAVVGEVRVRTCKNGVRRAFVKVAEPNVWQLRAVLTWELAHGPVCKGYLVHHHDRDTLNDDISNLRKMTRAEHINEHREELVLAKG